MPTRASTGPSPTEPRLSPQARHRIRLGVVAGLSVYVVWLAVAYRYHFVDGVNLLIHEAGHVVFAPAGEVMSFLGGSLLQLAFPLVFVFYFGRRRQAFEAAVCGVWAAESAMYTAEYMADANALALPLVGGHIHDWRWLFQRSGLLEHAEAIGGSLHVLAFLSAIVAVWFAARAIQNHDEEPPPAAAGSTVRAP